MANAGVDLSLDGGQSVGGYVSGSEPAVNYPTQPAGSPWASDPVGLEPPFSIVEPIGTEAEIIRAAEVLAAREAAGGFLFFPPLEWSRRLLPPQVPAVMRGDGTVSPEARTLAYGS